MSVRHTDTEAFAQSIRALLTRPLIQRRTEPDLFRAIAVHRAPLGRWFEDNLGWRLRVDLPGGIARLHKRAAVLDARRGLRRPRGARAPFDALRYQLLALACAHLLRRPHVTMGDLADALDRVTHADDALLDFSPTSHAHRRAFVDVLLWLRDMGALDATAGNLEGFSSAEQTNAVLKANTTVIPLLLSSDHAPSRIRTDAFMGPDGAERWIGALSHEPRHAQVEEDPDGADRAQRNQWARHQVLRRLLDDPVVDLEDLPAPALEYLQSPAGRDKVVKVVGEAGLTCERHVNAWLAVDPTLESSDSPALFGSRPSVVQQAAGILLAVLAPHEADGSRRLLPRSVKALEAELEAHMKRHQKWAQGARKAGVAATCHDALELLASFGLVEHDGQEARPRPAAARFVIDIDAAPTNAPSEN